MVGFNWAGRVETTGGNREGQEFEGDLCALASVRQSSGLGGGGSIVHSRTHLVATAWCGNIAVGAAQGKAARLQFQCCNKQYEISTIQCVQPICSDSGNTDR